MKKHDGQGDCRTLLMRMSRGVEGDLSPSERRALARHLAGCGRCGEFSESLKRTVRLCQEAGAPTMSARARTRARANIARLLKSSTRPARDARGRIAPNRDAEDAKKPSRR